MMIGSRSRISGAAVAAVLLSGGFAAGPASAGTGVQRPSYLGDCSQWTYLGPGSYNDAYCGGSGPDQFYAYIICVNQAGRYIRFGPFEVDGGGTDSVARCDGNDSISSDPGSSGINYI